MKTMKKIVSIGICIAMLTATALAEENMNAGFNPAETSRNDQISQQGEPPAMPTGGQNNDQQDGQPPQMPGMNNQDQQGEPPAML